VSDNERKKLERNFAGWSVLEIQRSVLHWRLEDLHANNKPGKMHQMSAMRALLS